MQSLPLRRKLTPTWHKEVVHDEAQMNGCFRDLGLEFEDRLVRCILEEILQGNERLCVLRLLTQSVRHGIIASTDTTMDKET